MAFPKDILILRYGSVHWLHGSQKTRIPGSNPLALRTGYGRYPNRRGAGIHQHPAAGAGRGPRGVNVINQQDVASRQAGGAGHKKSASQILPALVSGQARLTHRNAHAFQQARFQMQRPLGMAAAHLQNGCTGQQFGMIETSLTLFAGVHGHRDNQHLLRRGLGHSKGLKTVRQERTQPAGYWLHAVVLEQVNQRAKPAMVPAIGYRFDESRSGQTAGLAERTRVVAG
jgi:hypothetical protein